MGKEFKPLSWKVKNFDCNKQVIVDYDVLKCRKETIKKLKKQCSTKEEFAEKMRSDLMHQFWSRCEYEVVIEIDEDNRIWLNPWVGCYEPDKVRIEVTNDDSFDWRGFAEEHIGQQIYKNKAKFDVWDQIFYQWETFVDYIWNFHHKWQRVKKAEEKL